MKRFGLVLLTAGLCVGMPLLAAAKEGVVIGDPGVNVRAKADASAKIVCAVIKGDTVEVLSSSDREEVIGGKRGRWLKVRYKKQEGWAFSAFVSVDGDPAGPGTAVGDNSATGGDVNTTDDIHAITPAGIGPIKLGMAVAEAMKALPKATFSRCSDGDGAALISIRNGSEDLMVVFAGEDDPGAPLQPAKKIEFIETFATTCKTAEGAHPGAKVADLEKVYGKVVKIMKSEIEQREYIDFARQPKGFLFRLDYCGVFDGDKMETTRYTPGGKILSIAVREPFGE